MPIQLGERLKAQRARMNYTQQDMADQLQITPQAYSEWERGIGVPKIERIEQLCEILRCTSDYLLGLVDTPSGHIEVDQLPPDEQNLLKLYRAGKIPRQVKRLLGDLDITEDDKDRSTAEGGSERGASGKEKTA